MKLVSTAIGFLFGMSNASAGTDWTWQAGVQPEGLVVGASSRTFATVRDMLVSLACHDWDQAGNSEDCPFDVIDYYRALRDYGCNCYPENFDEEYQDSGVELWHMGHNGMPVDEVDQVCHRAFHLYHCFEQDGCIKGDAFVYHMTTEGDLVCGPEDDANYASDPDGFFCEQSACLAEKKFAEEVYPLIGNPQTFKDNNKDNYRLWNKGECVRQAGASLAKNECCGAYPYRKPYDANISECCSDGSVQAAGFC